MKMFKAIARKGMVKVTLADLAGEGRAFSGIVLREGQIIQFPKLEDLDPHVESLGKGKVYSINAYVGNDLKWVPLGSFRKTPHGKFAEEFLSKFSTNRELCEFEDIKALAENCAGKCLLVKEIFIGQKPIYRKAADGSYEYGRADDGSVATQPGNFPVFEWIDAPAE